MANYGFGITPVAIYKVTNESSIPWNDEQQTFAVMAASIADLNNDKAKGQFDGALKKLGINVMHPTRISDNILVHSFSTPAKKTKKLTDEEKRRTLALKLFNDESKAALFAAFEKDALDVMYNTNVKPERQQLPFVLHRIQLGDYLVYRITTQEEPLAEIVQKAINYVIEQKNADPAQFQLPELPPLNNEDQAALDAEMDNLPDLTEADEQPELDAVA